MINKVFWTKLLLSKKSFKLSNGFDIDISAPYCSPSKIKYIFDKKNVEKNIELENSIKLYGNKKIYPNGIAVNVTNISTGIILLILLL